ncbi:uncharacterized protein TRIADDRAFT_59168 [Trichoplax adhaerens]|uniref:Uncharacterized protein n=1 Tax=Trichoplax adhaerens TaxID=10228 RepID=B3S522_TRIAD|nr:predicted protein [Trichoplax adhaerens]EDV22058.1 predicted protein [Trichoplax adhaerens]|eukprot:XP_002115213.1 predicted protein [Trichoplax adhaerens]
MTTISKGRLSRRYEVIPSIESIFNVDDDSKINLDHQPEVFLANQLKFNLNVPTTMENLATSCKDPSHIIISHGDDRHKSHHRDQNPKSADFNILDSEELNLALRFAKQDINLARADLSTQTNTVMNKSRRAKRNKANHERSHVSIEVNKINKPKKLSSQSKLLVSTGLPQRNRKKNNEQYTDRKTIGRSRDLIWVQSKPSSSNIVKKERASRIEQKANPAPVWHSDKDKKISEIERLRSEIRKLVMQTRELYHDVSQKEADVSLSSAKPVSNPDKFIVKLSNRSIRTLYVLQKKIKIVSSGLHKDPVVDKLRFKEILTHIAVSYRGLIKTLEEFNRDIARRSHEVEVKIAPKVYKDIGSLINIITQCCSALKIAPVDDTAELLFQLYNDCQAMNRKTQPRSTSKGVLWADSRKVSKISDGRKGKNQEFRFLRDTESSRLKISDKSRQRSNGFDPDFVFQASEDPRLDGEMTLTPPESPTKQSLLPWRATSRSATPRNINASESIENQPSPTGSHRQVSVFDDKKSDDVDRRLTDSPRQVLKLRKSPRRRKYVNTSSDSVKNHIVNDLNRRKQQFFTDVVSAHGDDITEALLKYLIGDTVDELQRIECNDEMKNEVDNFLSDTNIEKVLQLIENIELQEANVRRKLNDIEYADTNDLNPANSSPSIPDQNPIVITRPQSGQLVFTNTPTELDDSGKIMYNINNTSHIPNHLDVNLLDKRVVATSRSAMDRVEQYCDLYKEYQSKVPQELSGTSTGIWMYERICDKLLNKLLESVGKEMEKNIDSYVENVYAAEFQA